MQPSFELRIGCLGAVLGGAGLNIANVSKKTVGPKSRPTESSSPKNHTTPSTDVRRKPVNAAASSNHRPTPVQRAQEEALRAFGGRSLGCVCLT